MNPALKIVLALVVSGNSAPNNNGRQSKSLAPPLRKCKSVRIYASNSGWMANFRSDGSGSFQYGSLFGDNGRFPKGTVDFKQFYKTLVPTLVTKADSRLTLGKRQTFSVFFESSTKAKQTTYTTETDAIRKAFYAGFGALDDPHRLHRLEYLLLTSNPFPTPGGSSRQLFVGTTSAIQKEIHELTKIPAGNVEQMTFLTRTGWKLTIRNDGSGVLSFGAHENLTSTFDDETFDFNQVYEKFIQKPLERHLEALRAKQRSSKSSVPVVVQVKVSDPSRRYPILTRDPKLIKELFDKAWKASRHPKQGLRLPGSLISLSIQNAWKATPPFYELRAISGRK